MPIGDISRSGFEPRMGSVQPTTKNALAGLGTRFRSSRRLRICVSIAVVVLLAAGCASGSIASQPTSAGGHIDPARDRERNCAIIGERVHRGDGRLRVSGRIGDRY